jgi:O-antigen ligase
MLGIVLILVKKERKKYFQRSYYQHYMNKNYAKIKYLILILNCSVIPLLITGPFLSDFSASLSSVLFLYICAKEKKWNYFNNSFFKLFFIFYLYYLCRSLVADDLLTVFTKHIFYIRHGIFVISTIWLLKNFNNYKLYFMYVAMVAFLILGTDLIVQFLTGTNLVGMKSIYHGRLSGLFGDEYVLGSYITRLSPLILGLMFFYFKDKKNLMVFTFCFLYIIVLLTGERSSFALMNIFLIYFLYFSKNFKYQKIFLILSIILVSFFSLGFDKQLKGRMFSHTFNQLGFDNNSSKINIFSKVHEDHIKVAVRMFKDNIFFGKGPSRYQEACLAEKFYTIEIGNLTPRCPTHPHHFYFQILAETGLVGFAFLLILVCKIALLLLRAIKHTFRPNNHGLTNYQILLIGSLIINLFPFVPSGNVFNNWMSIVYFLPIGFVLESFKKEER